MAARTWSAAANGVWSSAANWDGGATVPQAGDTVTFAGLTSTKNCTIDNIGAFNGAITVDAIYSGIITLGVSISGIGAISIDASNGPGQWQCNGFNLDIGTNTLSISGGGVFNTGSGRVTCGNLTTTSSGASMVFAGEVWVSQAVTLTFASSLTSSGGTLVFNSLDGTSRTWDQLVRITGGIGFRRTGSGSAQLTFTNITTSFGTFRDNEGSVAHTIVFPTGAGTITIANPILAGSSGKLLSIISSSAGTAVTLHTTGSAVTASYMSIKDSTVDASPTWTAQNSTNVSGNTNWLFVTLSTSNNFGGNFGLAQGALSHGRFAPAQGF